MVIVGVGALVGVDAGVSVTMSDGVAIAEGVGVGVAAGAAFLRSPTAKNMPPIIRPTTSTVIPKKIICFVVMYFTNYGYYTPRSTCC